MDAGVARGIAQSVALVGNQHPTVDRSCSQVIVGVVVKGKETRIADIALGICLHIGFKHVSITGNLPVDLQQTAAEVGVAAVAVVGERLSGINRRDARAVQKKWNFQVRLRPLPKPER